MEKVFVNAIDVFEKRSRRVVASFLSKIIDCLVQATAVHVLLPDVFVVLGMEMSRGRNLGWRRMEVMAPVVWR